MVKFLGPYDPWGPFLDFSPSVHRPARRIDLAAPRPQATGKTHPYMAGQPLPAHPFGELGSPDDLDLTLKSMILNDLILKEFSFQLKGKMEVFSKTVACADATRTQDVNF